MISRQVVLTFEESFLRDIKLRAKNLHMKNLQQYFYDFVFKDVYGRKTRRKYAKLTYDDLLGRLIAKPTQESKKRLAWAKKVGLWR